MPEYRFNEKVHLYTEYTGSTYKIPKGGFTVSDFVEGLEHIIASLKQLPMNSKIQEVNAWERFSMVYLSFLLKEPIPADELPFRFYLDKEIENNLNQ